MSENGYLMRSSRVKRPFEVAAAHTALREILHVEIAAGVLAARAVHLIGGRSGPHPLLMGPPTAAAPTSTGAGPITP